MDTSFGYLKQHSNRAIEFDTLIPDDIEEEKLNEGWINSTCKREDPKRCTNTKREGYKIIVEVYDDHVHDQETRMSVT